jgi:stage III sporulation protein AB
MSQNGSAGTAWREAIQASRSSMSCSPEDWAALEEFATSLGLMDKDNQIKSVQSVILRIEANLREAQEKVGANDRILRYAGFALGLVLVLIFI